MSDRPSDLPNFKKPPVMEVGISVQFESVAGFHVGHFGRVWDKFRTAFPTAEMKPPLHPEYERLGVRTSVESFQIQMLSTPTLPSLWLTNEDNTHLIQIQPNRFSFNWRRITIEREYPHFEEIRDKFISYYLNFITAILECELPEPVPDQAEVTYFNHVHQCDVWREHRDASVVFSILHAPVSRDSLPIREDTRFDQRYLIEDSERKFLGRLAVSMFPAFTAETDVPIFVFNLTARGWLGTADTNGIKSFLNLGRDKIVRGFAALTTEAMHKVWERIDV